MEITNVGRQLLLFGHVLIFAFAIVTVLREDFALFRARRIEPVALEATGRTMSWLLALLWISGGSLILLDSGMDLALLATKSKLATKLTVVSLLTVNGLLLHWVAFPMMTRPQRLPGLAAGVCATLGAISSVTWVYASFVGVARLIAPSLSYAGFMDLYLAALAIGVATALIVVRPRIAAMLTRADDAGASPATADGYGSSNPFDLHEGPATAAQG
ncbi:MAG: hypothetical protein KF909_16085 [Rhodocyclaceae bacterium]|nr:hypothetical protein [Rhodocyclaceae bacterium]MCB1912682.1 hypothetical protein [Rhodocyclaceae bacterium]